MKDIIYKRRKELGLTQLELADKLFISDKVVSKWETGKSVPGTSMLVELSKVLKISLDELLNSGKEENEKIKITVSDTVKIKYKNVLITSITLAIIASLVFFVSRIIDFNDDQREYEGLVFVLFVLSLIILICSVSYFMISRNKLIIDYPRFNDIDKLNINRYFNVTLLLIFVLSCFIVITHRLEIHEIFITILIIGLIEFLIWCGIHYLIKNHK